MKTLNEPDVGRAQGDTHPLGKRILTEDGVALGNLVDLECDAVSGLIRRLVLADDDLAGKRLLGIGPFAVVVTSPDRVSGSGADSLEDLSRNELYERAKRADLPGRSSMTKRELIEALS